MKVRINERCRYIIGNPGRGQISQRLKLSMPDFLNSYAIGRTIH